jgi:hypothetical protein
MYCVFLLFYAAPLINEQPVVVKERISYAHQYNSRTDPNEPTRGKVSSLMQYLWLTTDPVEGEMDSENLISQLSDRLVIIMGGA